MFSSVPTSCTLFCSWCLQLFHPVPINQRDVHFMTPLYPPLAFSKNVLNVCNSARRQSCCLVKLCETTLLCRCERFKKKKVIWANLVTGVGSLWCGLPLKKLLSSGVLILVGMLFQMCGIRHLYTGPPHYSHTRLMYITLLISLQYNVLRF